MTKTNIQTMMTFMKHHKIRGAVRNVMAAAYQSDDKTARQVKRYSSKPKMTHWFSHVKSSM